MTYAKYYQIIYRQKLIWLFTCSIGYRYKLKIALRMKKWHDQKPKLPYIQTFGSEAYMHISQEVGCSKKLILISYQETQSIDYLIRV